MTQSLPLDLRTPIVDSNGIPTEQFLIYWQKLISQGNYAAGALMPTPAPVIINYDYTGAALANELPRVVTAKRYLYGKDVSSRTRWFLSVKTGAITASIDQAGVITITNPGSGGVLTLKSVRDGVTLIENFNVSIQTGMAPTAGTSGGGATSQTVFTSINAPTMASICSDVVVTVGSTGVANLQATLNSKTGKTVTGTFPVYAIWRWWNGTAYVDVSTEVRSNPDCTVTAETLDTVPPRTINTMSAGSLSVASSKTGLTANSSQRFQVFVRNDIGTPTQVMTFSGTATATGA